MIIIDELRVNEIAETQELLKFTWVDTYSSFLSKETVQKMTEFLLNPELLRKEAIDLSILFLVAKDENKKIVGLVTVVKLDDEVAQIGRLFVHPDWQRRGIGLRLLNESIDRLRRYKVIRVEIEEKNKKGINFYLKQGFKEVGTKRELIESAVLNISIMERRLAG
jgi:ribosomal protein S18 acetylase RimI-like enzyme